MSPPSHNAIAFGQLADLDCWLANNHQHARELWVRIYKSGAGRPSVTWTDCVVEAIRYGWIDGVKQSLDEGSYLQRLTPRRPKSSWSAKNRAHAERLIAEDRMTAAGLAQVEAARADGRWNTAYAGAKAMEIPLDFLTAVATQPAADAVFRTLDRKNLYAIYYRLQTAKTEETRTRRMKRMLDQLARGERFH